MSKHTPRKSASESRYPRLTTKDYIYCEDCQTYVDYFKYDCIEDTGHAECHWRFVTKEELRACVRDCRQDGCFDEKQNCQIFNY
jgi:hypothetical protein